tara:strand:- start:29 stop:328 length:300 start_codon:yes stop_codon:yes gene_type:complete
MIGDRNDFATNTDGRFRDVRFWSDIRTDAEILANKDVCLTKGEANLDVLFQMEEGTGAILNDLATADGTQNGTIVNGNVWSLCGSTASNIATGDLFQEH